ncbi:MAG: helix-turn-helix transcriptional regulator [Acidaminococcaceae bacterium]|nr:helix-turn-helix transcriptional regulator [Acidaminococcaceae bacterium]
MIRFLLSTRLGELRYTQADLAKKTNIRASTINDYYWELSDRINLKHLDLICEVLQCDISDLLVRVPDDEYEIRTKTGSIMKSKKNSK